MRLAIVSEHRQIVGGTEKYLQRLLACLQDRGYDLGLVYCHEAKGSAEVVDSGLSSICFWNWNDLGTERTLDALACWQPDLIFVHALHDVTMEQGLLSLFPCFLFAHDHYRTCPTGAKAFTLPMLAPCQRPAGFACLGAHYARGCGGLNPVTALRDFGRWRRTRTLVRGYRRIFVGSRMMADELSLQGVPSDKITITGLPLVDINWYDVERPRSRPFTNRIVFLGRLEKAKGASVLVRAVPLAEALLGRRLSLVVAGDGPQRDALERLARQLNVNARFPGWISGSERRALLQEADLVAVPSLWSEPYGLVGGEAGAVGTPAVGFAVGGIPEWLRPGITGELAEPKRLNARALAQAVARALRDAIHHQMLREGAWAFAANQRFSTHLDVLERGWGGVGQPLAPGVHRETFPVRSGVL